MVSKPVRLGVNISYRVLEYFGDISSQIYVLFILIVAAPESAID